MEWIRDITGRHDQILIHNSYRIGAIKKFEDGWRTYGAMLCTQGNQDPFILWFTGVWTEEDAKRVVLQDRVELLVKLDEVSGAGLDTCNLPLSR